MVRNCASNCWRFPILNRPSAIACSIRRFRCSIMSPMSGCCRSPMVTGRSGIGSRASRRDPPTQPRLPKWWVSRFIRPALRRSASISKGPHERGKDIMPVTVKTFATSGEAASALSSERSARYLGGGTLVMRALNEGDLSVSTVVRATDRSLTQIEFASSRITIGAGVPFARVLAGPDPQPGALVLSVSCQRPHGESFRYRKISRIKPKGGSLVTLAALLPASGGRVVGARIAYGAMAAMPVRAKAAERAIEGRALDAASVGVAVVAATEGTSPTNDSYASAWYRREVIGVHLRRLLTGQE